MRKRGLVFKLFQRCWYYRRLTRSCYHTDAHPLGIFPGARTRILQSVRKVSLMLIPRWANYNLETRTGINGNNVMWGTSGSTLVAEYLTRRNPSQNMLKRHPQKRNLEAMLAAMPNMKEAGMWTTKSPHGYDESWLLPKRFCRRPVQTKSYRTSEFDGLLLTGRTHPR